MYFRCEGMMRAQYREIRTAARALASMAMNAERIATDPNDATAGRQLRDCVARMKQALATIALHLGSRRGDR